MESFVFNRFKERMLEGGVELNDTWHMYPVNRKFSEVYGDFAQYAREFDDFVRYDSRGKSSPTFAQWYTEFATYMNRVTYEYKPMYDTDVAVQPEFVTKSSWSQFTDKDSQSHLYRMFFENDPSRGRYNFYRESPVTVNDEIQPRGFYYVRTAEELKWCADKVNDQVYDNTINIVLGDNIGSSSKKKIAFSIGTNPAQPYEGILFGNGFMVTNIELHCNNTVNGLVGYLGTSGVIIGLDVYAGQHNSVDYSVDLVCGKRMNISHIASNGADIVAGVICGKNNGLVADTRIVGTVKFNGFIPEMYSVRNKTDNGNGPATDANMYYPDYLCYNSMGNIVPYIGYFNEGVFATYSGYSKADEQVHNFWNVNNYPNGYAGKEDGASPIIWKYWHAAYTPEGYALPYTAPANRKNVLWYDSSIISNTYKLVNPAANGIAQETVRYGLTLMPAVNPADDIYCQEFSRLEYAQYFDKSVKMSQQNRAAYYVSPLVGMNNGTIENVFVSADCKTSGTFVGFMGGIAGKQSVGSVINGNVEVTASDTVCDTGYERDMLVDTSTTPAYSFRKKSIKNIGGLFGSCIVGNANSLTVVNTKARLHNTHSIILHNNDLDYVDYYFLNRFGSIAAMVEYNSSNISDIWQFNGKITQNIPSPLLDVDDAANGLRSMNIINSKFAYTEKAESGLPRGYVSYGVVEYDDGPANSTYMFGNVSTLFGEIKPYYLSVPSVISTPFHNTEEYESNMGILYESTSGRIGLFTVDQNFAAPASDPNFWSVNAEVDLPGVANLYRPVAGYAGGVIDRLNCPSAANFSLDIRSIASRLVRWNDVSVESDQQSIANGLFSTVIVPAASQLDNAQYITTGTTGEIIPGNAGIDQSVPVGASAAMSGYNGNKALTLYPYFGSDLVPIVNTVTTPGIDVAQHYSMLELVYTNSPYYMDDIGEQAGDLHFKVRDIRIRIKADAMNYAPFTNIPITPEKVNENYEVQVRCPSSAAAFLKLDEDKAGISPDGIWTEAWQWSGSIHGDQNGKLSELLEIFEPGESKDNAKKWFDMSAFSARSGWYFYDGWDDTGHGAYFGHTFIPLDTVTGAVSDAIGVSPPKHPFMIGNILGHHESNDTPYTGTYKFPTVMTAHRGNRRAFPVLTQLRVSAYPLYYDKTAGGEVTENIAHPDLVSGKMTGYVAIPVEGGVWEFVNKDDESQTTLNPGQAKTAYVVSSGVIANVTAQDGTVYPIYGMSDFDTNALYSAYTVYGDSSTGNYQEFLQYVYDEVNDEDVFNYEYSAAPVVWPDPAFIASDIVSGKFVNGLVPSYETQEPSISNGTGTGDYEWQVESGTLLEPVNKGSTIAPVTGFGYMPSDIAATAPALSANHEHAAEIITAAEYSPTYFMYTYTKTTDSANFASGGIDVPVRFDYANYRAGFWFQGDARDSSAMFNDDFAYSGSILSLGQTYSEKCIMRTVELNGSCTASGFAADDFDGLYVTDGGYRPVMYIDVGMGRCEPGTTWSYSCRPNHNNPALYNDISGLLLEVNADV